MEMFIRERDLGQVLLEYVASGAYKNAVEPEDINSFISGLGVAGTVIMARCRKYTLMPNDDSNAPGITWDEMVNRIKDSSPEAKEAMNEAEVMAKGYETGYQHGYRDGKYDAFQWTSISDDKPPEEVEVFVAIADTNGDSPSYYTTVGWYTGIDNKFIVDNEFNCYVTHWMSKPGYPAKGGKE